MYPQNSKKFLLIGITGALLIMACSAAAIIYLPKIKKAKVTDERAVFEKITSSLKARSRIAKIYIESVAFNDKTGVQDTKIKFVEYDVSNKPLEPMYYVFNGDNIQVQSLVISLDNLNLKKERSLMGKSAYIFWKIFMLGGKSMDEEEITKINDIPRAYKIKGEEDPFEQKIWESFWNYALDTEEEESIVTKNVTIESKEDFFIPGTVYTLKMDKGGAIKVDAKYPKT